MSSYLCLKEKKQERLVLPAHKDTTINKLTDLESVFISVLSPRGRKLFVIVLILPPVNHRFHKETVIIPEQRSLVALWSPKF